MSKINAIIVDIDGTIASHEDIRGHYEYDKVHLDKPKLEIMKLIDCVRINLGGHVQMIFVSGRDSKCRTKTEKWLKYNWSHELGSWSRGYEENLGGYVFMREKGDRRPDDVVKEELYRKYIEPDYNVLYVFDDRDRVVRMWRNLGLTCLQVAEGNF